MRIQDVRNKIAQRITELEKKGFRFKPDRNFYKSIGINHKRFGLIYRNETAPTIEELAKIASYFDIPFNSLIDTDEKSELTNQEVIN